MINSLNSAWNSNEDIVWERNVTYRWNFLKMTEIYLNNATWDVIWWSLVIAQRLTSGLNNRDIWRTIGQMASDNLIHDGYDKWTVRRLYLTAARWQDKYITIISYCPGIGPIPRHHVHEPANSVQSAQYRDNIVSIPNRQYSNTTV